ncbi:MULTISPECIES: hypothetical protein [unclassified Bradyrhizobium]|uniref:hypothetical protein n=1 Tax=unclassified Bradyrhizobium TaxID=2631580 RepID=UPI0028E66A17|nr:MULTISPECIES: hypothetical protein [unclassified Bradyrhizobium]
MSSVPVASLIHNLKQHLKMSARILAARSCVRALRLASPSSCGGRREGRALAAPVARLQQKKQAAVTTGLAENARPSLREWF